MKEASNEADGPFAVHLKDGRTFPAKLIDGGGIAVSEGARYEVHGTYVDDSFLCIPQDEIAAVVNADGVQCEFGNPYYPGHPRPQELPAEV